MSGGLRDWFTRPLLGLHLLAIVAIAVCILMGLWQLGVYGAKHDDEAAARANAAPVDLLTVWGPDDAFTADLLDRRVIVNGEFTGKQFSVRRGAAGSWTVAPLKVAGTKSFLFVVRGWSDGTTPLPSGRVRFTGWLQPSESAPSGPVAPTDDGLSVLSIPALTNEVPGDLFSGFAVTPDRSVTGGLKPVSVSQPKVAWTVGLRNLAYALQWWVFGLFSAFMWWRMAIDALATHRSPTPDPATVYQVE